jgi:hypothetical protein
MFSKGFPPTRNAFYRKLAGDVIRTHIDKAHIVVDVVNPIGRDFPQFLKGKVMVKYFPPLLFRPVFPAVILEVAYCSVLYRKHNEIKPRTTQKNGEKLEKYRKIS